ncbi:MAG: aminotransferase class I/II-fold pyridoxal phosphate-dependent enzyme, partial [Akkermansiaceae bacterium]|nr:aminotransferase class I/II-fold pyridoxal phosphate-dependent enzyme [Akkermansiaceae bacterium]
LEQAVLDYLQRRHGAAVAPEQLVHFGGLVPALSLAGRAFAGPGESLMTCTPVYPPFLGIHRDGDLGLITIPHVMERDRWSFDWDAMEAGVTPGTRLFILSQPQNPLGRV